MSNPTRPVVVAVADKQPSALRFAVNEALSCGASLRVVYAYGVPPRASQAIPVEASIIDELRRLGQSVLDEARQWVDELRTAPGVEYVLSGHTPLDSLMLEATKARCLVVGADDVPWYDRLLRTKVAGYLAMHAPCPVIVVPELEFPTGPEGEVVLTLDGVTPASGPLHFAFDEANARDCLLHVLHATPPGTLSSDAEASRASVSELIAGWRESYPDVAVLEANVVGDTIAVIDRATQSAELVVIGRPHSHLIPLALVRPVASEVLRKAQCPVAVVPVDH